MAAARDAAAAPLGQQRLFEPAPARLPLATLRKGGRLGWVAEPAEGCWQGKLQLHACMVGDALYLLRLLERALADRGDVW